MLQNWLVVGSALACAGCGSSFDSGAATSGGGGASGAASGAATAGTAVTSSATAAGSTGSGTTSNGGCADGTREAYPDPVAEPNIAGCDGIFQIGGVTGAPPACGRQAGNTGT